MNVPNDRSGRLAEVLENQLIDPGFVVTPRYWVAAGEATERAPWGRSWFIAVRGIAGSVDARKLIGFVIPRSAVSGKMPLLTPSEVSPETATSFVGIVSSFAADYVARQTVGGSDLTWFGIQQLPLLTPLIMEAPTSWAQSSVAEWESQRVLEVSYTAWDLAGFAADLGYQGPPFRWDPARRELLRAELDAAFSHLYDIERDDVDYIIDTFPIVRRKGEAAHGEYRTKRLILERYDSLAEAAASDTEYQTILDPPPAHPSCAHLEGTRPAWAANADKTTGGLS